MNSQNYQNTNLHRKLLPANKSLKAIQHSLQGTELETFQSKCNRFKKGKFMSLDGNNFLSVTNLWEKSKHMPTLNYENHVILKQHESDTPWNIPFTVKDIIELLKSIKGSDNWTTDEIFQSINFEQDILPKINPKLIEEKIKVSLVDEKNIEKIKKEFFSRLKHIFDANLNYPIIINCCHKILDGNHRLIQTAIREIPTIKAKQYTLPPGNEDIFFSNQEWKCLKNQLFNKK